MPWILPTILLIPLAAVFVSLATAFYVSRRHDVLGAGTMVVIQLLMAVVLGTGALELMVHEPAAKVPLGRLSLTGFLGLFLAWLVFAAQVTGRRAWFTSPWLPLLYVGTAALAVPLWLGHPLSIFRAEAAPLPGSFGAVATVMEGMGLWFLLGACYALAAVSVLMLVSSAYSASPLYQKQVGTYLVAIGVPAAGDLIFRAAISPYVGAQPALVYLTVTSFLLTYGLLRYRVFEIVPIARATVFRDLADGVIVLDTQNRVVDMNLAAQHQTSRTYRQALGLPLELVLPIPEELNLGPQDTRERRLTLYLHSGGQPRWFTARISPLVDNQRLAARLVMLQDTTDQQQAHAALEQAKITAEEATRLKSEFVATISHEIRTPINAVIGMTELLGHTPLDATQREYLDTLRVCGESLLALINNLLDFSKLEAGRFELEAEPFNLCSCLETALEVFAPQAIQKKVELVCAIDPQIPQVITGDALRLRQVLFNLIGNAVKFTDAGEIVVGVTSQKIGATYRFHLWVSDTGPGIPPHRADRLFQVFSQLDPSTARRYGGSGLGLAISKHLVELMGGTLWVESEVGVGSTFHFTLIAEAEPSIPSVHPSLTGKRILVVEHHPTTQHTLVELLESWGLHCHALASGHDALPLLEDDCPFDLAMIGLEMPQMDGEALLTQLRTRKTTSELPVIILSPFGSTRLRDRTDELQIAGFITKPIRRRLLGDMLVQILGTPTASRDPRSVRPDVAGETSLSVLVAEDNQVAHKIVRFLLERLGHQVEAVADGEQAVVAVTLRPFDVVLMDVHMPVLDGLEATRRIRELLPATRQPYIVGLTATDLDHGRDICLAAGMDDFLPKPVREADLTVTLQRAARRHTSPVQ